MTLPVLEDLLLILGTVGCVILFVSLKRDIQISARRQGRAMEALTHELDRKFESHPAKEEARPPEPAPMPASLRPGFNNSTRVHALRMLRRGEDANHIAAALGVPIREVELLIRVQEIAASRGPVAHPPAPLANRTAAAADHS